MIRTKAYILREISKIEKSKRALKEELALLNKMDKLSANQQFLKTKIMIKRELIVIEGKLLFADWCANTSEKSLPKIKSKKKKKKQQKPIDKKENKQKPMR